METFFCHSFLLSGRGREGRRGIEFTLFHDLIFIYISLPILYLLQAGLSSVAAQGLLRKIGGDVGLSSNPAPSTTISHLEMKWFVFMRCCACGFPKATSSVCVLAVDLTYIPGFY